jgi:hypothetical protein
MPWTVFDSSVYWASLDRCLNLWRAGVVESYQDHGLKLPLVRPKPAYGYKKRKFPYVTKRWTHVALAPIQWACLICGAEPINALVVKEKSKKPGKSCSGTVDKTLRFEYTAEKEAEIREVLNWLVSTPGMIASIWRSGVYKAEDLRALFGKRV